MSNKIKYTIMNVFEAAKKVENYVNASQTRNLSGIVAIKGDTILDFNSLSEAVVLCNGAGFIFSYYTKDGAFVIRPEA